MSAWDDVSREVTGLATLLNSPADTKRLYAFADGFVRLAKAYHAALKADGKSSIRIQAVEKALDLKTAKSALQQFVGPTDSDSL